MAILVSLESLQNGYELHEKVLIRMGWDMATAQAEEKLNSPQQPNQTIDLAMQYIDLYGKDNFVLYRELCSFVDWLQESTSCV